MVYCTLFGGNYLDKGIVMIKSLYHCDAEMKIYVLAMDSFCLKVLREYNLSNVELIPLQEFEDSELLKVKEKRSLGEYCWSCTAKLIEYVIAKKKEKQCTYVDSDLFFFSDPMVLINEMKDKHCCVQTTTHRFPDSAYGRYQYKLLGTNCVQFVTFTNEEKSLALLKRWKEQCLEQCSVETGGDQKYTDEWSTIPFVDISQNGGAGVAPWNINRYKLIDSKQKIVYDKNDRRQYKLIFYHFQNVINVERNVIRLNVLSEHWEIDKDLFKYLYCKYLRLLEKEKRRIEKKYNKTIGVYNYISDVENKKSLKIIKELWEKNAIEKMEAISNFFLHKVRKNKIYLDVNRLFENSKS